MTAPAPLITVDSTGSGTSGINYDSSTGDFYDVIADNSVTLSGTAEAGSTVTIFDGTTEIGTAVANSAGDWSYVTGPLSDGNNDLTATATDHSGTSPPSSVLDVLINSDVTITSNTDGYATSNWQYIADNGVYNVGNMVNGINYTTSLTLDPATFPNGVKFSWAFPVQQVYWNWVVQAMPNVKYEAHDASGNQTFTQLANFTNLTANYSVQLSGNTTQTDVAFDLFFYASPTYGTPVAEVEVLVHSPWTGFPSDEPFSVTVPGLTNAQVDYINSPTPLILVSTPGDVLSDSISLADVLRTLVWNELLSAQDYIGAADFGSEVAGGTGGLTINNLSYNWTANPSLVGTAGNDTFVISTMGGNDVIGNGGVDTVVYTGSYSNYQIKASGSEILITEGQSISTMDVLQGISFIKFSDGTYNVATGNFVPSATTSAPAAPIMVSENVIGNRVVLTGTAAAGDTVSVYDGTTLLGTTSSNSKGNWVFVTPSETNGAYTFTATATDTAGNVSALSNGIDPDIGAGPAVNAAPVEVGNQYYLYNSSGSDVALMYAGAVVTAGEFGGWTPIAAVQTATGYDVAWKMTGANEYTVWATNSSGNAITNLTGPVSGTSYALESLETTFNQDLNGDGVIGITTTVIKVDGSISLTEVANQYCLNGIGGSGPALKYAGADVTAGEFGGWTPIGAVQTATGYDVAWKMADANEYTVWTTDSNGNTVGNLTGPVSGTSYALESLESTFNQDLNGDGVIGLYAAPGATLLIQTPLIGTAGSVTIGAGAMFELNAADSGSVTFASSTGNMILNVASTFSGEIFNFTGNGSLSGSDQIDLRNINFNTIQDSYANGILTVTDGTDTDKLDFNGSYTLANFAFVSDGSGGTVVYDPPASTSSSQNASASGPAPSPGPSGSTAIGIGAALELAGAASASPAFTGATGTLNLDGSPSGGEAFNSPSGGQAFNSPSGGQAFNSPSGGQSFNFAETVSSTGGQNVNDLAGIALTAQTTLGYLLNNNQTVDTPSLAEGTHGANIALLANFMASSFATPSDNHGGTIVAAETSQPDNQSLLSNPHHA